MPAAPSIYRGLYYAALQGLGKAGHTLRTDGIYLGETAPLGSERSGPRNGMRPVPFLRELVCVAPDGTQYAGADFTRRNCGDFAKNGPLQASAFAHHPYTKKAAPTRPPASPDEITIGNVGTLGPLLDTLAAQSGGRIPSALPILLTEFGYESNPPDPRNGIPLARQAEFNQLAEFLSYNEPRVQATTQFLLRDVGPVKRYPKGSRLYWFTYQSGLKTAGGTTKPAAFAYALPLVVFPSGPGTVGYWGQLRFRPNVPPGGTPTDVAALLWRPTPTTPWTLISDTVATTARGFFSGTFPLPGPGGEYRAVYVDPATQKITHSTVSATLG